MFFTFFVKCSEIFKAENSFGIVFAIYPYSCVGKRDNVVRFLHLFKFGLVVLGGQPPGAAGNREIPCCFCFWTSSSYCPECTDNAWRNNLRITIYVYANGYYEVRAKCQSDTPLILPETPPEYETRVLSGMVRCIKDN